MELLKEMAESDRLPAADRAAVFWAIATIETLLKREAADRPDGRRP